MSGRNNDKHGLRNRSIFESYLDGARYDVLAEEYHLSYGAIRKIVEQQRVGLDKVTVEDTRARLIEVLNSVTRRVLEVHRKQAPPRHDQRGQILRDENGEVVRNFDDILNSAVVVLRLTERISKVVGSDAPAKFEFDSGAHEAAEEAAAKAIQQRPNLRVVS